MARSPRPTPESKALLMELAKRAVDNPAVYVALSFEGSPVTVMIQSSGLDCFSGDIDRWCREIGENLSVSLKDKFGLLEAMP